MFAKHGSSYGKPLGEIRLKCRASAGDTRHRPTLVATHGCRPKGRVPARVLLRMQVSASEDRIFAYELKRSSLIFLQVEYIFVT